MGVESPVRTRILGIPVDLVDRATVRHRVRQALCESQQRRCLHLVTLNPEYVMMARREPAFADAIERADLITADGVGVVLALHLLASRVPAAWSALPGWTFSNGWWKRAL
ncbi:MAG: hypothetical protein KatS3mg059_1561 [Thermomicrobiales bacterium]|nr:MAG: hypothetical protein KatS3mg059_1561 [Thermomicrobiales bacterium]